MRFGLGKFKLTPEVFWKLTFKEFAAIWDSHFPPEAIPEQMTKAELDELMERFPDGQ